jgi:hypothetical protein
VNCRDRERIVIQVLVLVTVFSDSNSGDSTRAEKEFKKQSIESNFGRSNFDNVKRHSKVTSEVLCSRKMTSDCDNNKIHSLIIIIRSIF